MKLRAITAYLSRHHVSLLALFVALGGTAYAAALPKNSVTTKQIKNGQVQRADIAANAVDSARLLNNSILSADIKDGSVAAADVADGSLGGADVADGSLGGADLTDGSVAGADLAAGAISTTQLADKSVTPGKQSVTPAAVITGSTPTTISSSSTLSFATELSDTAGLHSPAQPTRLTAPIAGVYVVTGLATWDNTALGGFRQVNLEINGTGNRVSTDLLTADATVISNAYVYQNAVGITVLQAGDYLEMTVAETAGGNVDLLAGQEFTTFAMTWIGPAS